MNARILISAPGHLQADAANPATKFQAGGVAVEFALSLYAFILLMMLTVWAGVYGYQYAAANIATELGARAAAVCYKDPIDSAKAVAAMSTWIPVTASDVTVKKLPDGCTGTACTSVQVTLVPGYQRSQGAPFSVSALTFPSSVAVTKRLELPDSACSAAALGVHLPVETAGLLLLLVSQSA